VDCGGFVCCGEFNKCGESRPAPFGWNAITSEREFVERLVRFLLIVGIICFFQVYSKIPQNRPFGS
jgi:hypothetical protein